MKEESTRVLALAVLTIVKFAQAINPDLVGTWTSKSGKVLTGSSFYDPISERLFEPNLTGISYSFALDGYYEEALFRAISNATTPTCPSAVMQWQHGRVIELGNGSLALSPFSADGRELLSQACIASTSTLTRYYQPELFSKYEVLTDLYHGRLRLNLWQWDGTPVNPMWLAYRPPEMLPLVVLNPTASSPKLTRATTTSSTSQKRDGKAISWKVKTDVKRQYDPQTMVNTIEIFWVGIGVMSIGGLLVFVF